MTADPPIPAATAIVLAGGRSSRFGRDKLAEPIAGRPMVQHALAAVAAVAADVLIAVPPVGQPASIPRSARGRPVRIVRDPEPFGGPLVAVLAALERAGQPYAIVVGGDMPRLVTSVLAALVRALDAAPDADAVVLEYRGRARPLPVALRVGVATPAARRRLAEGERSLQALLAAIRVRRLGEPAWRALDPAAGTLTDVDRPEDLPR